MLNLLIPSEPIVSSKKLIYSIISSAKICMARILRAIFFFSENVPVLRALEPLGRANGQAAVRRHLGSVKPTIKTSPKLLASGSVG